MPGNSLAAAGGFGHGPQNPLHLCQILEHNACIKEQRRLLYSISAGLGAVSFIATK